MRGAEAGLERVEPKLTERVSEQVPRQLLVPQL